MINTKGCPDEVAARKCLNEALGLFAMKPGNGMPLGATEHHTRVPSPPAYTALVLR